MDMPKPLAWIIIAVLIAAAAWLVARRWQDVGLDGLLFDGGIIVLAIAIAVTAGALSSKAAGWLKRTYKQRFVAPPWQQPRIVHEQFDRNECIALIARLDPIDQSSRHPRISFHRDRFTGQLWQLTVSDIGNENARVLKPIDEAAFEDEEADG